jgi:hypothetical protein
MGRHSAPDDDEDVARPASATAAPVRPARHARADEPVDEAAGDPAQPQLTQPEPAPAAKQARRGGQSTAADLALLRERADVRNRCIAAVVVPFVLYTVVIYLIGAVGVYLLWIWIPLVAAGVLAGSILDAAHRKPPRPDAARE